MALYNTAWSDLPNPALGTERVEVDAGQTQKAYLTTAQIAGLSHSSAQSGYQALTATTAATLTAAQLTTGRTFNVIDMTGTLGAGAALTLPTVASVVALRTNFRPGMSWTVRIINDSSANFAWTLTTATGWGTLGGTQTIAQNTWRDFVITLTSATAGTVQSVGIGTNS